MRPPLRRLEQRFVGALLLATLCGPALAQTSDPQALPPSEQKAVQDVRDALSDPNLRPPGEALRDLGIPTRKLTLEDALRRALTNHPDLRLALANIEAQEFGVIGATASRYPSFSFNAGAGQSGTSGQLGGQDVIRTGINRSYSLGIGLNQQLLDFGRTHYRVKIAELNLAQTRLGYIDTRQQVINNVVQAYFNLLRSAQAIEVGFENVRNAELLVDQARGFLEAGTRAKIELIRAEAGLANAKFLVVQAQGGYGRALAALASALGEPLLPQELPEPVALELPDWDVEEVRQLARRARPDLIIASLDVATAEAQIRAARAEYYPSISASAGYSWSDSVFPPVNTGYNVGINLNVPLINEPALSSAVNQAVANYEGSVASLESTELRVVQEATEALYTLREAVGSAESAREALRFSEENFRLANERYRVGVGNSLEVSEAQRLLVQARVTELQARFDVQNAIGNLLNATGQIEASALLPPDLRLDPIFDLPAEVLPEAVRDKTLEANPEGVTEPQGVQIERQVAPPTAPDTMDVRPPMPAGDTSPSPDQPPSPR